MVSAEMSKQALETAKPLEDLTPLVSQQVEDILEESDRTSEVEEPPAAHWFYQVPFAGVRYYRY